MADDYRCYACFYLQDLTIKRYCLFMSSHPPDLVFSFFLVFFFWFFCRRSGLILSIQEQLWAGFLRSKEPD